MDLRPQLQPPEFDGALLNRLADLAASIDGARPGEWEEWLEEFNRLAGTDVPFDHFQGIYGGEDHIDWVRRLLISKAAVPVADVTRDELVEVIRRAMTHEDYIVRQAYMVMFDANVALPNASNLIFYPPDYDAATNTWADGCPIGEYNPTPEEIVDWAQSKSTE